MLLPSPNPHYEPRLFIDELTDAIEHFTSAISSSCSDNIQRFQHVEPVAIQPDHTMDNVESAYVASTLLLQI